MRLLLSSQRLLEENTSRMHSIFICFHCLCSLKDQHHELGMHVNELLWSTTHWYRHTHSREWKLIKSHSQIFWNVMKDTSLLFSTMHILVHGTILYTLKIMNQVCILKCHTGCIFGEQTCTITDNGTYLNPNYSCLQSQKHFCTLKGANLNPKRSKDERCRFAFWGVHRYTGAN